MAGEQNVIEIVIRSVDQLSGDLKRVEGELARLGQAGDRVDQSTQRLTRSNRLLTSALNPMRGALGQVTTLMAQMNPEYRVAISSLDNLGLAMTNVGLRGGGMVAILKQGGIIAIVIGIAAAIGELVSQFIAAKKAAEEFEKTMQKRDVTGAGYGKGLSALSELQEQMRVRRLQIEAELPKKSGFFQISERIALEEELKNLQPDFILAERKMMDQILKTTIARQDANTVLAEELRILKLVSSLKVTTETAEERASSASQAKALELSLLRQLGPEHQLYIDQVVRETRALIDRGIELNKNAAAYRAIQEIQQKELNRFLKTGDQPGDDTTIDEELVAMEKIMGGNDARIFNKAEEMAKTLADSFSHTLTDRIVSFLSGDGTISVQEAAAAIGKSLVSILLQTVIAELLAKPLQAILIQWMRGSGSTGEEASLFNILKSMGGGGGGGGGGIAGLLGMFGGGGGNPLSGTGWENLNSSGGWWESIMKFFGSIGGFFGFAHGGMVMPQGALQKFQHGGVVRGPTLGVIGEEGPEIVARMKPMRSGEDNGGDLHQNIYIVDQRPPRLGRNDVLLIVDDDMQRGGRTAKGVKNVVRRGG